MVYVYRNGASQTWSISFIISLLFSSPMTLHPSRAPSTQEVTTNPTPANRRLNSIVQVLYGSMVLIAFLYKKNRSLNLYKKNKGLKFWIFFPIVVVQKPIQPMRVETTKTRNNKLTLNYNTCCFSTSHSLQDYFLAVSAFFFSNITKFLLLQIILCNKQARTWNQRSPFSDTPYLWGWGHIVRLKSETTKTGSHKPYVFQYFLNLQIVNTIHQNSGVWKNLIALNRHLCFII